MTRTFVDLGMTPMSNSYVKAADLDRMEPFYPLVAHVCDSCFLVQVGEFVNPQQIFADYAYFSSYSKSWIAHCERYAECVISRFQLGSKSLVVEVASNDGYLLQFFQKRGIPVLGIEPAANVATDAELRGVPTLVKFFNKELASTLVDAGRKADLLVCKNVLGHVPDINSFVGGLKVLLAPGGVITVEFPHLLTLIQNIEFDTIYHEHYSYLSLLSVEAIFAAHGLKIFDVDQIPTHGGSLRIYAAHCDAKKQAETSRLQSMRMLESDAGMDTLTAYTEFGQQVLEVKLSLLEFLGYARRRGKAVAGYGAPAKGNTLLNYCGIGKDLLPFTVDISPHKQGLYLPGTHIPIYHPDKIREAKPDYILILPWNLRNEIVEQLNFVRDWGCKFVVPIPKIEIIP